MNVLAYMALVALDRDEAPHYWEGHAALAVHCLGRDEASIDDSDLRAVRRAVTPLFKAGAITVAQHSSGRGERRGRVSYRLHLGMPAQDGFRPVDNPGAADPTQDGNRPVDTASTGRYVAEHRTVRDRAPDGNRPAKEYEETEEQEEIQEHSLPSSDPVPVRAGEARDGPEEVTSVRLIASPLLAVVPDAEKPRCRYADCPGRAEPLSGDEYHPSTCAYLVTIKPAREASAEAS
jgi:hypothetical protein